MGLLGSEWTVLQICTPFHVSSQPHSPGRAVAECLAVSVPFSLLSDGEKTSPCPEMKTQLAIMKKKPPLENSRPDSAISAKMFLSVHRLTLQVRVREPQVRCLCKSKFIYLQGTNSWLSVSSFSSIRPLWTEAPQKGWAIRRWKQKYGKGLRGAVFPLSPALRFLLVPLSGLVVQCCTHQVLKSACWRDG